MKILFVADTHDRGIWESLIKRLSKGNFCIHWCNIHFINIEEVIQKGKYDLIIFMSYLSNLFSVDFMFYLSEKKIPFVVVAQEEEQTLKRKMSITDLGCDDLFSFLKKPFELEKLVQIIQDVKEE